MNALEVEKEKNQLNKNHVRGKNAHPREIKSTQTNPSKYKPQNATKKNKGWRREGEGGRKVGVVWFGEDCVKAGKKLLHHYNTMSGIVEDWNTRNPLGFSDPKQKELFIVSWVFNGFRNGKLFRLLFVHPSFLPSFVGMCRSLFLTDEACE